MKRNMIGFEVVDFVFSEAESKLCRDNKDRPRNVSGFQSSSFLFGIAKAFDLFGKLKRKEKFSGDVCQKSWQDVARAIRYGVSKLEKNKKFNKMQKNQAKTFFSQWIELDIK